MKVALTFDDGPSRWTEPILEALARHGAQATFFLIGSFAERQPELVRRIAAGGHELGNHTWSHPRLARDCDDARVREELVRTSDALAALVGSRPQRFRAPYHDVDARVEAVAAEVGLAHTGSTLATPDWHDSATAALIVTLVLQRVHDGAVVGLHDGVPPDELESGRRDATVAAVERVVPTLQERGFECVTVSALAAV